MSLYIECRKYALYAECRYTERLYADCRYPECHSAPKNHCVKDKGAYFGTFMVCKRI